MGGPRLCWAPPLLSGRWISEWGSLLAETAEKKEAARVEEQDTTAYEQPALQLCAAAKRAAKWAPAG